jgi:two-component system nitrogen regulation sensor histidine kinase NtrY
MSVDQAAAETTLPSSPPRRGETRVLGPIAVGLALLSAFVTFVVLADLTPIAPTHYVVVSLLLANAATVILLIAIIVREVWQVVHARRDRGDRDRRQDPARGVIAIHERESAV